MLKQLLIVPLSMLSACATIMSGTTQTLTVSTTPPAASCTLDRMGEHVAAVPMTPGSVVLDKSKNDLSVACSKEGFETTMVTHSSSFNGATFGNIIAGGLVGVLVDASSGANFNYPADIRIDMRPNPAPIVPPMALAAPPVDNSPVRVVQVATQYGSRGTLGRPAEPAP